MTYRLMRADVPITPGRPLRSMLREARRRGWFGAHARSALRVAGVVTVAGGLAACGTALPPPDLPNIPQIEQAIQETLAAKDHLSGTAYCPVSVPELKGEVFSCVVALRVHAPVIFTVTEVNSTGYVTYVER